jgi:cell division protein FtsI/penicillin-binding protein 2
MPVIANNRKYAIGSRCELGGNENANENWRIYALVFFIFTIALAVFLRLYNLQVFSYTSYRALAEGQHKLFGELFAQRGEIYLKDKNNVYPVAVNRETKMAYAVPKEIENAKETAGKLAEILALDRADLENRLGNPEDMYEVLKHRLSDEETEKIRAVRLAGVHLEDEFFRYYPSSELASNVLGFVGWKDNDFGGRYGLEAYFDKELTGQSGNIIHSRDASGKLVATNERQIVPAQNGDSLILTIDHIVQYETEKILKSAVQKFNASGGSIIIMEPDTGKILSLANYPTFDPNNYAKVEDINAYRNPAVSDPYECGSVFKSITLAAGLDSDKITPETTYTDTGAVKEAGYTIKNSDLKANGLQTMTQVLEKSLNTGAVYVERLLGNKNFADYVERFGFGERTGIDFLGEGRGDIKNLDNARINIQFYTASFGQGITVTPIQLLSAYSALANGGVLMKPQIVEKIIHADGEIEEIEPQEVRRVISEKASLEISQMLRSVVTDGHGKRADVPGYLVAGKTGTAQVASNEKKGYEEGRTEGSFAGFAPADNPRFAILVKIDDPKNVEWAESSAAPTFGELMKFLLEYYNIEPTVEYDKSDLDKFDTTHNLRDSFMKKDEKEKEEIRENQPAANAADLKKKNT